MTSQVSMVSCRRYAQEEIEETLKAYDVLRYDSEINAKEINSICLKMGYLCSGNKQHYDSLASKLVNRIYAITEDETERGKLFSYANRNIVIGKNYGILSKVEGN
ncbi:MAG: hypothetical protein PVI40_02910 [Chlamydiota bacterium]|jgi:hypothetical protein